MTDRSTLRARDSIAGMCVVESPFVPADTLLLINPRALTLDMSPPRITTTFASQERATWLYEQALSFVDRTTIESDPMTWGRPRGWRAALRRMARIVGYEYRKAAGAPRRYSDRPHAVLKGLSS